jgi:hypothetical protein
MWSRLIRFVPEGRDETPVYGEPVGDDLSDIGALADAGKLSAKLVEPGREGPLAQSARITDNVVKVQRLLGPLGPDDCTDIKCIGLNFRKHSKAEARRTRNLY